MRLFRLAPAGALLALAVSGCFEDVLTLQPLHTQNIVVSDPRLVGTWKFCDPSALDWDVTCKVSETTDHGYRIVVDLNGKQRIYIGYVVDLGKIRVIDLSPEQADKELTRVDSMPAHWFARLEFEGNRVRIHHSVSSSDFRRLVQSHPLASHTKDVRLVVTASTAELQAFYSQTGEAAFDNSSKIVLHKCADCEVIKPTFAGFDPFTSPWSFLFESPESNVSGVSAERLKMPPLSGVPYSRVKQLADEFVRMGHEVRFIRGSKATSAESVFAVEAQEPLPGAPLRPNAAIVLRLYCKDATEPLPAVRTWETYRWAGE